MSQQFVSLGIKVTGLVSALAVALSLTAAGVSAHEKSRHHAHDADSHYVYVPNRASADLAVIDTTIDEVVARVPVGKVPHQVILAAGTGKLVASNTADNTISIVDLESLQPQATIKLGHQPEHMQLSFNGETLAVGNIGAGTVSLVSLTENREVARVEGLFEPHNLTFSADDTLLYVANLGADHVSVIDVARAEVVKEIPVAPEARTAALGDQQSEQYQGIVNVTQSPDGRFGFAAHGESGRLAVIDLASQEKVKDLTVGHLPWRAFAVPGSRYMLVPNNGDRTVSVIDSEALEVVATLPGAAGVTGINGDGHGKIAFVISHEENKAVVLDLTAMATVGEIALPGTPETGVTTPDGAKLYVALSGAGKVAVIDTASRAVIKMIDGVGAEPWGATMAGADNYCH